MFYFLLKLFLYYLLIMLGIRLIRNAWREYRRGGRNREIGGSRRSGGSRPSVAPPADEDIVDAAWEELDSRASRGPREGQG